MSFKEWIQEKIKDQRFTKYAVFGGLAVVLVAAALAGQGKNQRLQPETTVAETAETEDQPETLLISDEERAALDGIIEAMEKENYPAVAAILNNQESLFQTLFEKRLEENICLYDGSEMHRTVEGKGLVLRRTGIIFYGSFQNGVPEGECKAIQAAVLDAPRYDYSFGHWKSGRMEGEGEVGYNYYVGVQGGQTRENKKEGTFSEDLMDGTVIYTSVNAEGVHTTWTMETEKGVTKKDDRWTYLEETGEYQLLADNDAGHAYVMTEDALQETRWRNMILWEY